MQVFTADISVPVLVLLTKFDALLVHAMGELDDENCDASLEALLSVTNYHQSLQKVHIHQRVM